MPKTMITAEEALQKLKAGNRRYLKSQSTLEPSSFENQRKKNEKAQNPFAIILGCSDSRVPVGMVFDHGIGDLFVIRVAGSIATSTQIGSVEFAAHTFGTRLVVVLGHSNCGAVVATIDEIRKPSPSLSPGIASIVNTIRPAVEPLVLSGDYEEKDLVPTAVERNIRASVAQLKSESPILQRLESEEGLRVVGAHYCIRTGVVDFLD